MLYNGGTSDNEKENLSTNQILPVFFDETGMGAHGIAGY